MESNSRAPALEVIESEIVCLKLRLETLQRVVCPDFWRKSVPEHRPGDSECTAFEVRLDVVSRIFWRPSWILSARGSPNSGTWRSPRAAERSRERAVSSAFGIRSHAMEGLEN